MCNKQLIGQEDMGALQWLCTFTMHTREEFSVYWRDFSTSNQITVIHSSVLCMCVCVHMGVCACVSVYVSVCVCLY